MADRNDYLDMPGASAPTAYEVDWQYYQFMYRDGEAVVVMDPVGAQFAFYVKKGSLTPMRHRCLVTRVGPEMPDGTFSMTINTSSIIAMRKHRDGICRGTPHHWGGQWTALGVWTLKNAVARARQPARPWGTQDLSSLRFPTPPHPSGLPPHELEDCPVCAKGGYSGLPGGACSECFNTGLVPKTQRNKGVLNMQDMITVIQLKNGAKVVSAKYTQADGGLSHEYHFKNVVGVKLEVGDKAVVESKGGLAIVTVVDPDVRANTVSIPLGALKNVVSRVDTDGLKRVQEAENNAMHALALSEVTARLDTFKAQIGEQAFNSMAGLLAPPAPEEEK